MTVTNNNQLLNRSSEIEAQVIPADHQPLKASLFVVEFTP